MDRIAIYWYTLTLFTRKNPKATLALGVNKYSMIERSEFAGLSDLTDKQTDSR